MLGMLARSTIFHSSTVLTSKDAHFTIASKKLYVINNNAAKAHPPPPPKVFGDAGCCVYQRSRPTCPLPGLLKAALLPPNVYR